MIGDGFHFADQADTREDVSDHQVGAKLRAIVDVNAYSCFGLDVFTDLKLSLWGDETSPLWARSPSRQRLCAHCDRLVRPIVHLISIKQSARPYRKTYSLAHGRRSDDYNKGPRPTTTFKEQSMSRVNPSVHAERLNHLKEALDISEQQLAQWVRFRGAVNAVMRLLPEGLAEDQRVTRANYPSLPVALDIQFRQSLFRLEVCRTMRAHVADLYSVLADKQRVLADRLLMPVLVTVMESEHRAPAALAA